MVGVFSIRERWGRNSFLRIKAYEKIHTYVAMHQEKITQFGNFIKALSIAQRFIVVRLLFPVQGITALYEQKYTSFKLVRGIGNQLSG